MLESLGERWWRRQRQATSGESVKAERAKSIGVPGDDARHFPGNLGGFIDLPFTTKNLNLLFVSAVGFGV